MSEVAKSLLVTSVAFSKLGKELGSVTRCMVLLDRETLPF